MARHEAPGPAPSPSSKSQPPSALTSQEKTDKAARASEIVNLRHIELKLDALLRAWHGDSSYLNPTERLLNRRFHLYAQNEEDGIVFELTCEAGGRSGKLIDIGCGHNGGNSGVLVNELLFGGLMIDGDESLVQECAQRFERPGLTIAQAFVTAENVNTIVEKAGVEGDIDFLSIDIDGNDIWIWEAITSASARVACVEYNSLYGAEASVAVPYDPGFIRRSREIPKPLRGHYYGASLRALVDSGRRRGYRLVVVEPRGVNAFFLREDVARHIPATTVENSFRMLDKNRKRMAGVDVFKVAEEYDLPLVDLA